MAKLRYAGVALTVAFLGVAEVRPIMAQSSPERGVKPTSERGVQPKALEGAFTLSGPLTKELSKLVLPPDWDAELKAHNALRLRFNKWIGTYNQYMGLVNACLSKNHTIADQQAAGCVQSDTLSVCMDKIYNQCINHSLRAHVTPGMPGLVEAATALSVEAANLAKRIPNALPKPH
jgi:hypothetical protein